MCPSLLSRRSRCPSHLLPRPPLPEPSAVKTKPLPESVSEPSQPDLKKTTEELILEMRCDYESRIDVMQTEISTLKTLVHQVVGALAEKEKKEVHVVNLLNLILSKLDKNVQSDISRPSYASVVSSQPLRQNPIIASMQAQKFLKIREEQEKDRTFVIVGSPEVKNEDLVAKINCCLSSEDIPNDCIETAFRHGKMKPEGQYRIIKAKISPHRVSFYHKIKSTVGKSDLCWYTRDDLTSIEQQEDSRLRSECRLENKRCGFKKYIVKNLQLTEVARKPVAASVETASERIDLNANPQ
ncbi:unnamed protein product [Caenorhabditis auriculariae]|uniref:Uncharacterized protein n=1 Tax=Caenorhabditis auriculariae TaxID=2777116 RepID=A0A8S1HP78_9PELO|nr:unnamed protein product [Caenorhabditis auriculariae]